MRPYDRSLISALQGKEYCEEVMLPQAGMSDSDRRLLEYVGQLTRLRRFSIRLDGTLAFDPRIFPALEDLHLGGLRDFDAEKLVLPRLKTLELFDCPLATLPDLCALESLERLSIRRMPLSRLPLTLAALPRLKHLHLEYTEVDAIPEVVSTLPLETLTCMKSRLREIPDAVASIPTLRQVICTGNLIETFPEGFVDSQLTVLFLDDNRIKAVPEGMGRLARRVHDRTLQLRLSGNRIQNVRSEWKFSLEVLYNNPLGLKSMAAPYKGPDACPRCGAPSNVLSTDVLHGNPHTSASDTEVEHLAQCVQCGCRHKYTV